jgi:thiamine-phosphate pyrophosphorylase
MRGLYAIADVGTLRARNVDVIAFAGAVLLARPCALQLRAKDLPAREILALLRALRPMCKYAGVPLVANDRVDVAALAGCDYVHIGQHDVAYEVVHRIAPTMRVGVSTHDAHQLARTLTYAPAYVAYGPVFETRSKVAPDPVVGLAGLRAARGVARDAGVPLVAIGGITLERAREVGLSADAGAVIGALLPSHGAVDLAEVTSRARQLHALLCGDKALVEATG